jgi:hypothetical protein
MSHAFLCNFDNKPGGLCGGKGCRHAWIVYVPMASGFRCDACRVFQRDDLERASMHAFHDQHAMCTEQD